MLTTIINNTKRFIGIVLIVAIALLPMFMATPSYGKKTAGIIKIGLPQEPKTLNIWLASDRWSRRILSLMYQPLYTREPETLQLIPWLAEKDPVFEPETLSYTIKLRPAKWSDGSELTAEDVAFTGRIIKEFKIPRYFSKWKFIKKIETPDKQTVKFYLDKPMATFLTRTLITPIVSKKEWLSIVEEARNADKPLTTLLNKKIKNPVGSGPFVFKEWKQGAYLFVQKNRNFFGTGEKIHGRLLGPFLNGIIFKFFGTADAAILAIQKGSIDMFWWGIQSGYLDDLKASPDIRLFTNERSALYYMGFNLRKPPFDDVNLRQAVATLIDKDFIISRILQGYGEKMISVVPTGNRFWHFKGVPRYGEGLSRKERIKKAYTILKKSGYTWKVPPVDNNGGVTPGKKIRMPDGQLMKKITILTPPADYDPLRAMSGMMIQEWLKEIGIPASAKPMSFGALLQQVKVRREFDSFILAYGRLSLDPDWIRYFFHSSQNKKQGGNTSGYRNPDFDRIADRSARTVNRKERQKLIHEMQKIILRDVPFIPLYNPILIEAVRKDGFTGWVETLEGIGNIWSFCELKPK